MKILLDECLPLDFRRHFSEHETHTAEWAGFKGKKNSELLRCAEAAGYDVLITVDQGIRHQLPAKCERLSVILLRSRTNQIADLISLVGLIREKLCALQRGEIAAIP